MQNSLLASAPLVRRTARTFWRTYLARTTCIELADVEQHAWLALVAHPEAVGGLRYKRILWGLHDAYSRRRDIPHREHFHLQCDRSNRETAWGLRSTVRPEELEYLYQNLWAVGTEKTVEALTVWLGGTAYRNGDSPGVDQNTIGRALVRVQRAFPSRQALLGPSRALWLHPSCESALAGYSGLAARGPSGRLKRLKPALTQPTADARAFYDRQLAFGWGRNGA